MLLFIKFLFKKHTDNKEKEAISPQASQKRSKEEVANRKGEIGEYKIDIQLDQLPKYYRYISDLLIMNPKATSGYSQIDHVVLTPYGIFVIETKNYQGTIYGGKDRKTWFVNGKFKMMNPFIQNYGHIKALASLIDARYHNRFISMVSFTKRGTFKVDMDYRKIASDELIIYDLELTEFIQRKIAVLKLQHEQPLLTQQDISHVYESFFSANITDLDTRESHIWILKTEGNRTNTTSTCIICQKPVSNKVKCYCLANKRLNGKNYCYEHQKNS
ncbi:nuclease-related domain-containing protein [Sutcliffiella rhizosphaerae]|uniref:NERD domain-containing protein n=1 Tax=Sutcliffiella rhizosphaerae TaxID=2880967 RepID=A0ABM8YMX6_9BACI|nr:nuclease-related domain-containing protein [Sutcliffiella rhizosphaerae]CAG9621212.1 hypothetical protein BACCIP111883_01984 [Sutcliffiella rhizosphaerae]